jgi:hypothetical protein
MEFTDEQIRSLKWQLNLLGFAGSKEILSTAQILGDGAGIGKENVVRVQMVDPNGPEGAKFVFLASQTASEKLKIDSIKTYKSFEINPSTGDTKEYMAESEMSMLLDKQHLLQRVEAVFLLDKTKMGLLANKALKDELLALGFKDYDLMVENTVALLGRPILSASFELPERIGTGGDRVQFNIWLGSIKDEEPQTINCIYATYDSPVKIISDPDFTRSQAFVPRKGGFPTTQAMTNTLLARYRDYFLGAAKAFQIRENIQKAVKTKGEGKNRGL